jgi:hypothetical protein
MGSELSPARITKEDQIKAPAYTRDPPYPPSQPHSSVVSAAITGTATIITKENRTRAIVIINGMVFDINVSLLLV